MTDPSARSRESWRRLRSTEDDGQEHDEPSPQGDRRATCRTCPSPLPPTQRRYVWLCPGCIGKTRARVAAWCAARGYCFHDRPLTRPCRECARVVPVAPPGNRGASHAP